MRNTTLLHYATVLAMFLVGILIYANSIEVPFYFDDYQNVQNPIIQVNEISSDNISDIISFSTLKTRPVSNLSFALNHYFGGERVQGYHLVNILIHILTAITSYFLVYITLSFSRNTHTVQHRFAIAFFTALLWLCHPVATQSVTYIVQRMNSMASMLYIMSVLFYVIGRTIQRVENKNLITSISYCSIFALSCFTGVLALGSKETAATLPIAIFLYEWFFFQNLDKTWLKKKIPYLASVGIIFVIIAFIYTSGDISGAIFDGYKGRIFSLSERLFTQLRVIIHYFSILLFPFPDHLFLDHSFSLSKSLIDPISTLFSGLLIAFLIFFAILTAKKYRIIAFSILLFFLNLLIESSVIPLEIIYEHRTYLPSIFFILIFVIFIFALTSYRRYTIVILFFITGIFSYWTTERNATWNDPIAFWTKSIDKYPDNARIHTNLGVEYYKIGNITQAENHFRSALKLKPHNALIYNNLAEIKEKQGDYQTAETLLNNAIKITPNHVLARLNLASLYRQTGRFQESLEQYQFVHSQYPEFSIPNLGIGQLLVHANKPQDALKYLELALKKKPNDITLIMSIAEAHMRLGNLQRSIEYYEKANKLNNNLVVTKFNLALLNNQIGNSDKAFDNFQKAFVLQPEFIPVAYNYGNFLLRSGDFSKAENAYQTFLNQEMLMADAHNNLGLVYINTEEPRKALEHFRRALLINPSHQIAAQNIQLLEKNLK